MPAAMRRRRGRSARRALPLGLRVSPDWSAETPQKKSLQLRCHSWVGGASARVGRWRSSGTPKLRRSSAGLQRPSVAVRSDRLGQFIIWVHSGMAQVQQVIASSHAVQARQARVRPIQRHPAQLSVGGARLPLHPHGSLCSVPGRARGAVSGDAGAVPASDMPRCGLRCRRGKGGGRARAGAARLARSSRVRRSRRRGGGGLVVMDSDTIGACLSELTRAGGRQALCHVRGHGQGARAATGRRHRRRETSDAGGPPGPRPELTRTSVPVTLPGSTGPLPPAGPSATWPSTLCSLHRQT
jgi:hypothetical protein